MGQATCPKCRAERTDYEGPDGAWLPSCPNCGSGVDPVLDAATIPLDAESIGEYLDSCIRLWRSLREEGDPRGVYYVDCFQSVRSSLLGETLATEEADGPNHLFAASAPT